MTSFRNQFQYEIWKSQESMSQAGPQPEGLVETIAEASSQPVQDAAPRSSPEAIAHFKRRRMAQEVRRRAKSSRGGTGYVGWVNAI
jgi:hypothetical protein